MSELSNIMTMHDADHYVASVRPVMRVSITGRGVFRASMTRVTAGPVMLQQAEITQPLIATLAMPDEAVFGFGAGDVPSEAWNGQMLHPTEMIAHGRGREMALRGLGNAWGSITVSRLGMEHVRRFLLDQSAPVAATGWRILSPQPADMQRFRRLHGDLVRTAVDNPALLRSAAASLAISESIMGALADCLGRAAFLVDPLRHRRERLLRRLNDVFEEHAGHPLRLLDLCAAVDVPERTLYTIFYEIYGLSPIKFLRLRRMEMAFEALEQADSATATVSSIAMGCGFWELGRFAAAYHNQYGELPSKTLARPPRSEPAPRRLARAMR